MLIEIYVQPALCLFLAWQQTNRQTNNKSETKTKAQTNKLCGRRIRTHLANASVDQNLLVSTFFFWSDFESCQNYYNEGLIRRKKLP